MRDWLLCRSSGVRAPSLNVAQLCCITLQNPVVQSPFPALHTNLPCIQSTVLCLAQEQLDGSSSPLFLSRCRCHGFCEWETFCLFLKGAQGKEEIATVAFSILWLSDGKRFGWNYKSLVSLACILLATSIPRSRSRPASKAAALTGCCSGSVEAIGCPAPLIYPSTWAVV